MHEDNRRAIERALARIPRAHWDELLERPEGLELARRREAVRDCLRQMGRLAPGAPPSPVADVIDLLGHDVLACGELSRWIRHQLLLQLAPTKWERLKARYRELDNARGAPLHGSATQAGVGSELMAQSWQRGSRWVRAFCEALELPEVLAHGRDRALFDDEVVEAPVTLDELHDFQKDAHKKLLAFLAEGAGTAALLSLPTGAGKTRVAVDALCDHLAAARSGGRNVVLWIAQSDELLMQAWTCFRQVWSAPRSTAPPRRTALEILRAWGGRKMDSMELDDGPTVVIAGIQQLHAWLDNRDGLAELFPRRRLAAVVIDEAHRLIAPSYRDVFLVLGLRQKQRWQVPANAPPVIGLSATPWRSDDAQSESLREYFQRALVTSKQLGVRPIARLQECEILSKVRWQPLLSGPAPALTTSEQRRFDEFNDLPLDYLARLGREPTRNAQIVERLIALPSRSRALVFACSVEHAEVLTLLLNRAAEAEVAATVTGRTHRAARAEAIARFRDGDSLRFLCNVGVLTTGFDAPMADVVCITRPTTSAVLYEQMVGRGLRGPANGGTSTCRVLDVQDEGLPGEIMSYERVLALWDRERG